MPETIGRKGVSILIKNAYNPRLTRVVSDYTEGAELVDQVLDVVRKEAEGTECLQG